MVNRYRCPKCERDDCLWRGVDVPGWQSVDAHLEPARIGAPDREAHWERALPDGDYGCSDCGWEGRKQELIELGTDGEPLPAVHPRQESLL